MCTFWAFVEFDMDGESIATDNIGISGLPFSSVTLTSYKAVGSFYHYASGGTDNSDVWIIQMKI